MSSPALASPSGARCRSGLLIGSALAARGGAGEDFNVSLLGEWEINPTLVHLLKTDYQVDLNRAELLEFLDQDAEPPDSMPLFERITKSCLVIPGFSVAPRIVVGNFSYAKLRMVLDLETATDALLGSELICAIAGDEAARDAVRARHPNVALNEPDFVPPADEFLVLDADASQSYAINCGVRGGDLVIDGPPGTGKSQTIANLIASLSARGERVLFVAEKRAAIDAVLDRLSRVGLADLVLDVHGGAGSRRRLAADLARTLAIAGGIPKPDMTGAQDALIRRRQVLIDRAAALHARRAPWGVSVYEAQSRLLGIPAAATSAQRLRGERLAGLDDQAFRQAQAEVEYFIGLGGLAISEATTPWAGAFTAGTITTPDAARAALDTAYTLADHTLPETTVRLHQVIADCGLRLPQTVGTWVQALSLLDGVAATLAVFDPAIFAIPLDELAGALAPGAGGLFGRLAARISNSGYRRARKTALALWQAAMPKPAALHAAVAAAADQATAWRHAATDGGGPRLPADLAGAEGAFGQLSAEIQALVVWAGTVNLADLPIPELARRLQALIADTETLSKLPELARLRTALRGAGLWPLIEEISHRNLIVDQALACAEQVWLSSILDSVSVADPRIGAFDGQAHRRTVAEFRTADRAHVDTAAVRVRRAVAENAPGPGTHTPGSPMSSSTRRVSSAATFRYASYSRPPRTCSARSGRAGLCRRCLSPSCCPPSAASTWSSSTRRHRSLPPTRLGRSCEPTGRSWPVTPTSCPLPVSS